MKRQCPHWDRASLSRLAQKGSQAYRLSRCTGGGYRPETLGTWPQTHRGGSRGAEEGTCRLSHAWLKEPIRSAQSWGLPQLLKDQSPGGGPSLFSNGSHATKAPTVPIHPIGQQTLECQHQVTDGWDTQVLCHREDTRTKGRQLPGGRAHRRYWAGSRTEQHPPPAAGGKALGGTGAAEGSPQIGQ